MLREAILLAPAMYRLVPLLVKKDFYFPAFIEFDNPVYSSLLHSEKGVASTSQTREGPVPSLNSFKIII